MDWRSEFVPYSPTGRHQFTDRVLLPLSACLKSPRRQSSAATGRFRIRHRPLGLGVGNR